MRVALVLPGQGSQRPGAGAPRTGDAGRELVEQASAVLDRDVATLLRQTQLVTPLPSLVLTGPAERTLPDLRALSVPTPEDLEQL